MSHLGKVSFVWEFPRWLWKSCNRKGITTVQYQGILSKNDKWLNDWLTMGFPGITYNWLIYTVYKTLGTPSNIKLHPFCPQKCLNLSGHGLYKVLIAFHRNSTPCWLQCFPQLYQVGWMSFGWWTILDAHGKHFEREKPSSGVVLDTLKPVRLAPTTIPCSKALQSLVLTLWKVHIHNPCLSSQGLKIILQPVSSPSSTLIEVDLHQ